LVHFIYKIKVGGDLLNKKEIVLIILFLVLFTNLSFGVSDYIDIHRNYTSYEINFLIDFIQKQYPEFITTEVLGKSYDNREIKAIILKNPDTVFNVDERYTSGVTQYLITGGLHGREPVSSKLIIKQIQYYIEMKLIPNNVVLHFIPLVNPDGYELSQRGISTISDKNLLAELTEMADDNYPRWKSNLRGVDLNKNFLDISLDLNTYNWLDLSNNINSKYYSDVPSGQYYAGEIPGSEKETKIVMEYIKRYRLDGSLDYHSQGNVLFWERWYMSKDYNIFSKEIAIALSNQNGYDVMPLIYEKNGFGYIGDYIANIYRCPAITVELTKTKKLPWIPKDELDRVFSDNKNIVLEFVNQITINNLFGDIKAYDSDGKFFDDYKSIDIAKAYQNKYNLVLTDYKGVAFESFYELFEEKFSKNFMITMLGKMKLDSVNEVEKILILHYLKANFVLKFDY
jgi:g-D-glutamyl-meso-diaminopimelate peptidase